MNRNSDLTDILREQLLPNSKKTRKFTPAVSPQRRSALLTQENKSSRIIRERTYPTELSNIKDKKIIGYGHISNLLKTPMNDFSQLM